MMSMWIAAAFAQNTPVEAPSEELIVWGDPYLRWERRWHVETQVDFAEPFVLFAQDNLESRLSNLQMRIVLDCDRDVVLGPRREEVSCTIEDLALVARAPRPGADDLAVLTEVDAALTGARLQLQVSRDGGVPNVGIEGLSPSNARDRTRAEQYRQLLSRVILPFHLGMPQVVSDGVTWQEYGSRLMSMPSSYGSGGSTRIAHFMNAFEGRLLVQSIGEGIIRPTVGVDALEIDPGTGLAKPSAQPVDSYETELHGVAVFDLDTGIMSERVWAFAGRLTAGSPGVLRGGSYGHQGHLRLLGDADHPDVGVTEIVDASTWVSLAALGTDDGANRR